MRLKILQIILSGAFTKKHKDKKILLV